jgi:hypothetical protein
MASGAHLYRQEDMLGRAKATTKNVLNLCVASSIVICRGAHQGVRPTFLILDRNPMLDIRYISLLGVFK